MIKVQKSTKMIDKVVHVTSAVNCNFMKPRQYMTQARGGASADPDPDPRACVMYCRERTSTRETVEMKMWNKSLFLFSLRKKYSRGFIKLQLTD